MQFRSKGFEHFCDIIPIKHRRRHRKYVRCKMQPIGKIEETWKIFNYILNTFGMQIISVEIKTMFKNTIFPITSQKQNIFVLQYSNSIWLRCDVYESV